MCVSLHGPRMVPRQLYTLTHTHTHVPVELSSLCNYFTHCTQTVCVLCTFFPALPFPHLSFYLWFWSSEPGHTHTHMTAPSKRGKGRGTWQGKTAHSPILLRHSFYSVVCVSVLLWASAFQSTQEHHKKRKLSFSWTPTNTHTRVAILVTWLKICESWLFFPTLIWCGCVLRCVSVPNKGRLWKKKESPELLLKAKGPLKWCKYNVGILKERKLSLNSCMFFPLKSVSTFLSYSSIMKHLVINLNNYHKKFNELSYLQKINFQMKFVNLIYCDSRFCSWLCQKDVLTCPG